MIRPIKDGDPLPGWYNGSPDSVLRLIAFVCDELTVGEVIRAGYLLHLQPMRAETILGVIHQVLAERPRDIAALAEVSSLEFPE